jgi:hypothetical protein
MIKNDILSKMVLFRYTRKKGGVYIYSAYENTLARALKAINDRVKSGVYRMSDLESLKDFQINEQTKKKYHKELIADLITKIEAIPQSEREDDTENVDDIETTEAVETIETEETTEPAKITESTEITNVIKAPEVTESAKDDPVSRERAETLTNAAAKVIHALPDKNAEVAANTAARAVFEIATLQNDEEYNQDCMQLFDPCTGKRLLFTQESIKLINKRIYTIRQRIKFSYDQTMIHNDTSNNDFLQTIFLNERISLGQMVLFRLEGGEVGTDIFEVLCRLFVFFGGIEYSANEINSPHPINKNTPVNRINPRDGGDYRFMNKIEDNVLQPSFIYSLSMDTLNDTDCKGKNDAGGSDVTLTYQTLNPISKKRVYLATVKWFEDDKDKTPSEDYDIGKLNIYINESIGKKLGGNTITSRNDVGLLVFMKNKEAFEFKCRNDPKKTQKRYCDMVSGTNGRVYGWFTDVKPFLYKIRTDIFRNAQYEGISVIEAFRKQYNSTPLSNNEV